jgi:zinc protease
MIPLIALSLTSCWWTPSPGPAPFVVAAEPLQPVGLPAAGPVTWVQVTVRAGTAFDPPGKEGLAWLTAMTLREGGAGALGSAQVDATLDELGTDVEVLVDRELVTFRTRGLHEDQETLAGVLGDMLVRPQLEAESFHRLRDGSADFLSRGIMASDEALGLTVFESWLFAGHPYGHPLRGRAGVLPTLELEDVKNFLADRYVRPALTLGIAGPAVDVAGNIDGAAPGGAGLAQLRKELSSLPPRLVQPQTPRRSPPVEGRQLLVVEKPTQSTGVHFGHPLEVNRSHEDWPALTLAFTALGEHRQSHGRLYKALRGERGLNYGDYAYVEVYRQAGWSSQQEPGTSALQGAFVTWLRPTAAENGPFALKAAVSLIEDFVETGLTPEEFESTRKYLSGRVALWADHPGRRLGWAVEARALRQPDPISDLPAALATLDVATVNAAIQRHIRPQDLKIVVVTGDGEAFVRAVEGDAPTPLTYTAAPPAEGDPQRLQDETWAASALGLKAARVTEAADVLR